MRIRADFTKFLSGAPKWPGPGAVEFHWDSLIFLRGNSIPGAAAGFGLLEKGENEKRRKMARPWGR